MFRTLTSGLALVALFAAVTILSSSQASAAVVMGVTIEDVSSEINEAAHTIDGTGGVPLDSADPANRHDANPGNMWLNRAWDPDRGDSGEGCCPWTPNSGDPHAMDTNDNRLAHIVYDLGAVHDVGSFVIWNHNEDHGPPDRLMYRSVKDVKVYTSTTDPLAGVDGQAGGTFLADIVVPPGAGRPDIPGEVFGIPFTARYVRLDVFSNYAEDPALWPFGDALPSNGDLTLLGISEIRFDSTTEPTDFEWNVDGGGNWSTSVNWIPGGPPNGVDNTVVFGSAITSSSTVINDDEVTVNSIRFDNPATYAVAGTGKVSLADDGESVPTISVDTGNHQFQVEVALLNDTTVEVASNSTLAFTNVLDLGGRKLTKIGDGDMGIRNDQVKGSGNLEILQGNVFGNGTVGGDVTNTAGTVAPGNSPGILTIDGSYTQGATGTLALEIGGLIAGEEHDKLVITGTADLNGTISVELTDSFTPAANDTFDVLDFASFVNSGYVFDFSQAGDESSWDTGSFETLGTLCFGECVGGFTDFNNSGFWDLPDLNLVLFNWQQGEAALPVEWVNQRPTTVGLDSLNLVLFNWQQPSSLAVVPEPASLVVLLLGLLAVGCWKRRP